MIRPDRPAVSGAINPQTLQRITAALRRGMEDSPAYLGDLATRLEEILPAQTSVLRVRDGLFGKPTRITAFVVVLGACHYTLSEGGGTPSGAGSPTPSAADGGHLVATCSMVCGGTTTASMTLALDAWLDLLAHDLAAYDVSSAVARRALSRLVA